SPGRGAISLRVCRLGGEHGRERHRRRKLELVSEYLHIVSPGPLSVLILSPGRRGRVTSARCRNRTPSPPVAIVGSNLPSRPAVSPTLRLPRRARKVLGVNLKCSESSGILNRWPAPAVRLGFATGHRASLGLRSHISLLYGSAATRIRGGAPRHFPAGDFYSWPPAPPGCRRRRALQGRKTTRRVRSA